MLECMAGCSFYLINNSLAGQLLIYHFQKTDLQLFYALNNSKHLVYHWLLWLHARRFFRSGWRILLNLFTNTVLKMGNNFSRPSRSEKQEEKEPLKYFF